MGRNGGEGGGWVSKRGTIIPRFWWCTLIYALFAKARHTAMKSLPPSHQTMLQRDLTTETKIFLCYFLRQAALGWTSCKSVAAQLLTIQHEICFADRGLIVASRRRSRRRGNEQKKTKRFINRSLCQTINSPVARIKKEKWQILPRRPGVCDSDNSRVRAAITKVGDSEETPCQRSCYCEFPSSSSTLDTFYKWTYPRL